MCHVSYVTYFPVQLPASPPYPCGTFDRILLDAPCSALGQRPQFVIRMNLKELQSYPRLQRKLFTTVSEENKSSCFLDKGLWQMFLSLWGSFNSKFCWQKFSDAFILLDCVATVSVSPKPRGRSTVDAQGRAKQWKLQFLLLFSPCPSVSRALLPYTTILDKIDGKFRPISPHGKLVRFCLFAASFLILGGWLFAIPF